MQGVGTGEQQSELVVGLAQRRQKFGTQAGSRATPGESSCRTTGIRGRDGEHDLAGLEGSKQRAWSVQVASCFGLPGKLVGDSVEGDLAQRGILGGPSAQRFVESAHSPERCWRVARGQPVGLPSRALVQMPASAAIFERILLLALRNPVVEHTAVVTGSRQGSVSHSIVRSAIRC